MGARPAYLVWADGHQHDDRTSGTIDAIPSRPGGMQDLILRMLYGLPEGPVG